MKIVLCLFASVLMLALSSSEAQQPKLTAKQLQQIEDQQRMLAKKGAQPAQTGVSTKELIDEMRALRSEIAELRRELKRK